MSGPFVSCDSGFRSAIIRPVPAIRDSTSDLSLRFGIPAIRVHMRRGNRCVAPANQYLPKKGLLRGGSLQLFLKLKAFQAHVLEENDLPCLADEVPLPRYGLTGGQAGGFNRRYESALFDALSGASR
jgi:hypothetical protein